MPQKLIKLTQKTEFVIDRDVREAPTQQITSVLLNLRQDQQRTILTILCKNIFKQRLHNLNHKLGSVIRRG